MSTQELKAPTPVGGVVLDIDFVPSIVFAALYGCFLPFIAWRFIRADRRTFLQITTIVFAIERIVVYALRASQAHGSDGRRAARGLLIYLQISFAQGYIGVLTDLLPLLQVLIVNATNGPDPIEPLAPPPAVGDSSEAKEREAKDDKRTRFITRFATNPFSWLWFIPLALNINQGTRFPNAFKKQSTADSVFELRYAATAVSLFLTIAMLYWLVHMMRKLPDMNKTAAHMLLSLIALLIIPSVYRLGVMHNTVPELIFTGRGSLTSTSQKALFYVFSEAPVWVATALLLVPNTRQTFQHGPLGDWRSVDGQKSWKESRKAAKAKKEQERREREAAAAGQV